MDNIKPPSEGNIKHGNDERLHVKHDGRQKFNKHKKMICTAQFRITNLVAKWPGSVHDARIFRESDIGAALERGDVGTGHLLGDSGYPCRVYLMTPYLHPQTRAQNKGAPARYFTKTNDELDPKDEAKSPNSGQGKNKKLAIKNKIIDRKNQLRRNIGKANNKKKEDFKLAKVQDKDGNVEEQHVYQVKPKHYYQHKNKRRGERLPTSISNNERDAYPGNKAISKKQIAKYQRGEQMRSTLTRSKFSTKMLGKKEAKIRQAAEKTARTELLLQEDEGILEAGENELTTDITQHDLAEAVDITSAQKYFELKMKDFGPYRINYTRNGRFVLFGGAKGHIAAVDWMTKKLLCEINVMESIRDVCWLHQETMYAVAQKKWTYIYDNQGLEIHCLKMLDDIQRLEFLPYHFLLASASGKGYLSYIDVSIGEKVSTIPTRMGRLDVMCQNPANGMIALGHSGGTVTQWCPKMKDPAVKMLCHKAGIRSVAIDKSGMYMATSGIDRKMKIWDMRTYKMLQSYNVWAGSAELAFSQKGLLATCIGNIVQVYKDCCTKTVTRPYMRHDVHTSVTSLQFCPYEDVLGVGHAEGFSSLIIPGAGKPNFDALESNPYQTKKQRREAEVKMLLDKIPADMISVDSNIISKVDQKTLKQKIEEHNRIRPYAEPLKTAYEPKYKMKGRSKGAKLVQRKQHVIEGQKREHIKRSLKDKKLQNQKNLDSDRNKKSQQGNVLDRFKSKT